MRFVVLYMVIMINLLLCTRLPPPSYRAVNSQDIDWERRRKLFAGADLGRHVIVGRDSCLDRCQGFGPGMTVLCEDVTCWNGWSDDQKVYDYFWWYLTECLALNLRMSNLINWPGLAYGPISDVLLRKY
ncbi:hypothetical protein BDV38DRAFT_252615 [Aspergillus pseudotamarii]|uniref:Uncharacterized protein n=1 Tax=Aspergillus pseudotamarii TaxID=132259 RepID=A0A5N6SN83_ASPPS|nr:uncharacterized protein BDV38DRAFT_252615 [Aspergillus pseudotamarii]KAE8135329.1 hypothetical protein BDV38DRAFT_252615 [Aspergillus pseudotamarii]